MLKDTVIYCAAEKYGLEELKRLLSGSKAYRVESRSPLYSEVRGMLMTTRQTQTHGSALIILL